MVAGVSYQGTILWVDLSKGTVEGRSFPDALQRDYLGGRALAARLLYDLVPPRADPLGPENVIVVATGPITGTLAPASGRFTVAAVSPKTGLVGHANSGGHFGPEMKLAGFDALVITGCSPEPVYLYLEDGRAQLLPAGHLWGQGLFRTWELLEERHGPDVRYLGIGPAGENQVLVSAVMNDGWDAQARPGLGAVWGAKKLKCIAARGSGKVRVADPERFLEAVRDACGKIMADRTYPDFSRYGTSILVDIAQASGGLSTRNAQEGVFEHYEGISSRRLHAGYTVAKKACWCCPLHCKNFVEVRTGPHRMRGGGPEYETLVCLGSRVGLGDLEAILYANHLCNDLGLDTISAGTAISFLMEASQRDLIPDRLPWGDAAVVIDLLRKMAYREGLGELAGQGVARLARAIPGSEEFALEVKGLELPAFDVRTGKGFGLSEATANRGGDHLTALPNFELLGMSEQEGVRWFGNPYCVDPYTERGKVPMVVWHEYFAMLCDSAEICKYTTFATYALLPEDLARFVTLATGEERTATDLLHLAERAYNLERLLNIRRGMLPARDDRLPRRYTHHPLPRGPARGQVVHLETMLPEYYRAHGWDVRGVPLPATLRRLGLEREASEVLGLGLEGTGAPGAGTGEGTGGGHGCCG